MPEIYETDGIKKNDKIAQLHYFYGNIDIYIFEKDKSDEQLQAFGFCKTFERVKWDTYQ